ncbi:MAG: hypothetical protein IKD69_13710 [Solobacterium sp.]|nr:hypothetical protein [Solobacterium sp.]
MQIKEKGIRVGKGESVMEAMQKAIPHWIHERVADPHFVGGYKYKRNCRCSVCGYESSFEKPVCPHCQRKMQQLRGI